MVSMIPRTKCVVVFVVGLAVSLFALPDAQGKTKNGDWQVSRTSICIAEAVLLRGTMHFEGEEKKENPIIVKINGNIVEDRARLIFKFREDEKEGQCHVFLDLFFDPYSKRFFFDKAGKYEIVVSAGDNENVLFSTTVDVREPRDDEKKALPLFQDQNSIEVLLTHNANQKGIKNLSTLIKDYPESPWAPYARIGVGIALFESAKRKPIKSKEDVLNKQKEMAAFADHFAGVREDKSMGMIGLKAKFYLAYCLALDGNYDDSQTILSEVAGLDVPGLSGKAKNMLNEIKTHRKE